MARALRGFPFTEESLQAATDIHPAIVFEPDGYRTDGARLMGRQAAGLGFLRAAVAASRGRPLAGYTARKASADSFAKTVAEIDPQARAQWLNPLRPDALQQLGHLYTPGPGIGELALQRLRVGTHAWSITGVTHTTASHGVMDSLVELPIAPVMPWDAVICTSHAVRGTVETVLEAQRDYLAWRFGEKPRQWSLPQLPVIPLGVHCADFEFGAQERRAARESLRVAADEVVALFVGRLSFHAKAHPHAMYAALEAAAQRSGHKVVLVQCGWFANDAIDRAFREGAAATCPSVRCVFTDGRDERARRASWAAADLFISLSDNIQETFGLTPIEAMAAGLPVLVTDWDGYKDTVRDGVDGFRIATWTPPAGAGERLAWTHEADVDSYDFYCGLTCQFVALDRAMLADRLCLLVQDEALRRRMGDAGRARAREAYDWAVVYRAYQSLWAQLGELRPREAPAAPRASPARLDPFTAFAHYPTHRIAPATLARRRAGANAHDYAPLAGMAIFSYAAREQPSADGFARIWAALGEGGASAEAVATACGATFAETARALAMLAKMGLVELADRSGE
ncbi:MAG TPA: glycosyltransferase family 4 protein [Ramlibacter sp.]|uniref:glycosyltransferase family 4 protein n=1 Tax=Ramlibacter sp. TaxID=1917967 RepID=UPI002B877E33|nr:glycosyltransferase family 4 protein [Ramlibacter sp.]HVZ46752.1 glycosyltransferase family 4 protein [Ramlibacter sp.]